MLALALEGAGTGVRTGACEGGSLAEFEGGARPLGGASALAPGARPSFLVPVALGEGPDALFLFSLSPIGGGPASARLLFVRLMPMPRPLLRVTLVVDGI